MPVRRIKYSEPDGPNWAERVMAGPEALYRAQLKENTWGHLSPVQGTDYFGFVTFILGICGDLVAVDYEFESADGEQLNGGPWLHEDIHEILIAKFSDLKKAKEGCVYQFVGRYRQSPRTGIGRFIGKIKCVRIPKPRIKQHGP